MKLNLILQHKFTLIWLLIVLLGGVFGGFIVASILSAVLLFIRNEHIKLETLFVLIVFVFFLGDNFEGTLSFTQNLRFVILVIGLVLLLRHKLLKFNVALYILPFSIVATLITSALTPVGLEAIIRGLGYFVVAVVVIKCSQILLAHDGRRFYNLIVSFLGLYFVLTIITLFIPLVEVVYLKGRFTGLMANPNGLGMLAMFSYAVIDVIRRKYLASYSNLFLNFFKVVLIGIIILTASRTGLFGVVIFEISVRLIKNKKVLVMAMILMLLLYNIIATLDIEAVIVSYGLEDYLRVESLVDASGRTEVWAVALEEIKQQPWLGKGMLYDNYFINDYADRYIGEFRARHWFGIWNSYISILLNVGIVGLLAFAFFWYKMFVLSENKVVRFGFLMMCLFSAITESWMAASMNAFMPLVFTCWALQIYKPNLTTMAS